MAKTILEQSNNVIAVQTIIQDIEWFGEFNIHRIICA